MLLDISCIRPVSKISKRRFRVGDPVAAVECLLDDLAFGSLSLFFSLGFGNGSVDNPTVQALPDVPSTLRPVLVLRVNSLALVSLEYAHVVTKYRC